MRLREKTEAGVEGAETEGPQGRGWGLIAKLLGVHPGTLGKGTGDKFYPAGADEEGILATREKTRNGRLFGEKKEKKQKGIAGDGKSAGNEEKKLMKEERKRDRSLQRDRTKANKKTKEKHSKGNNGKGNSK